MKSRRVIKRLEDRHVRDMERIAKVQDYITNHLHTNLNATLLAKHLALSESSLHHLFGRYHISLNSFIIEKRMEAAYAMIKAGKSVKEAMAATNYSSRSEFNNAFERKWKRLPGEIKP